MRTLVLFSIFLIFSCVSSQLTPTELFAAQDLWAASSILQAAVPYSQLSQVCLSSQNFNSIFSCTRSGQVSGITLAGGFPNELNLLPASICSFPQLTNLYLHLPWLTELPSTLWNCSALRTLALYDLYSVRSSSLDYIAQLPALASLTVQNFPVPSIPRSWTNLTSLQKFQMSNTSTTSFSPDFFANLTTVGQIQLSDNPGLTQFIYPSSLSPGFQATSVATIDLSGNAITYIPDVFSALPNLYSLALDGNPITSIPPSFGQMVSQPAAYFAIFSCNGCQLSSFPSFSLAPSFNVLHLSGNQFSAIPESICNLSSNPTVDFSFNSIAFAPSCLSNITNLQIDLSSNAITNPDFIFKLEGSITSVSLANNLISSFDPNITVVIKILDLSNNSFTSWPFNPTYNNSIQSVNLGMNGISGQLPDNVASGMPFLNAIYIQGNKLTGSIPESFSTLNYITISNNQISAWPSNLAEFSSLKGLDVSYNSISSFPASLITAMNYSSVYQVVFDGNQIGGSIPTELIQTLASPPHVMVSLSLAECGFTGDLSMFGEAYVGGGMLSSLNLANNLLNGTIPSNISTWFQYLGSLDLTSNQLTGSIPSFQSVILSLVITNNSISGTIPDPLNVYLTFHANNNQLHGTISDSLSKLNDLDLSNNQLTGPINYTISTSFPKFVVANNSLSGSLTIQSSNFLSYSGFGNLDVSGNNLNGTLPSIIQNLAFRSISLANNDFDLCEPVPNVNQSGIPFPNLQIGLDYPFYCDVTHNTESSACDCPSLYLPCVTGCPISPTPSVPTTPSPTAPAPSESPNAPTPSNSFRLLANPSLLIFIISIVMAFLHLM